MNSALLPRAFVAQSILQAKKETKLDFALLPSREDKPLEGLPKAKWSQDTLSRYVKQDYQNLLSIPPRLRDKELCSAAVDADERALLYVPDAVLPTLSLTPTK